MKLYERGFSPGQQMPLRLAITVAVLSASAFPQSRMGAFGPGFSHLAYRPSIARGHHLFYPGYGYYGLPYYYSDYEPYEEYVPVMPRPAESPPTVKVEPSADPVLLELHGSQWVRVSNFNQASDQAVPAVTPSGVQQISSKPLPPAVLVFRDGHTEEVSSYSIIGQTIYAKADYWSSGKWTREIQLANLNIPATVEQNHQRGINFGLPSSPDEIMIRP